MARFTKAECKKSFKNFKVSNAMLIPGLVFACGLSTLLSSHTDSGDALRCGLKTAFVHAVAGAGPTATARPRDDGAAQDLSTVTQGGYDCRTGQCGLQ